MRPSLLTLAMGVAAIAVAVAQEEKQGTVVAFEATDEGGVLRLSGGASYGVPAAVYETYRGTLNALERGSTVAFSLDANGQLARIRRVGQDESRGQIRTGRLVKVEDIGGRQWLVIDDDRFQLPLEVYKNSPLPYLKRGSPIRIVVEKGVVVSVTQARDEGGIRTEELELVQRSRRHDEVKINGREYRFLERGPQAIKASPRLPDGTYAGIETIKLEDVKSFENPAAAQRGGTDASTPEGEGDALEQLGVQVGDTIGLGLESGQVTALDAETCELRVWRNEAWGPNRSFKRVEIGNSARRVPLTSQSAIPLQGGEVHVRVHRTRNASKGGLEFAVEVVHDLSDQVLVSAKLKFHLGGLNMVPGSEAKRVEEAPVPVLFAGQLAKLTHRVIDEAWLDGWVELQLERDALVPLASPGAKAHLLAALGQEPADLNELTKTFLAAGGNGDEDLLRILIERALYPPGAGSIDAEKHAEAAVAGLERAGDRAARLIVGDLFFLDRNLRRAVLEKGELRYEPLNRMKVDPPAYKKELIRLLGRLPGALKGEAGQKVFQLYQEQQDHLGEAIQRAYAARPAEAIEALLAVATSTHSGSTQEELKRAEDAATLLRRLGQSVLDEMLRELRRREIPVGPLQELRQKQGITPGEVVHQALALLVADSLRRRREALDARVKEAMELQSGQKWGEALTILRDVLRQDSAHDGALEQLPTVLVSLATKQRAEGGRGEAAQHLEEAVELLPPARQLLAKAPLAEIYLEVAREDAESLSIRAHPHPCAARIRPTNVGEGFPGQPVGGWVELDLGGGRKGYLPTAVVRESTPGRWDVVATTVPRDDVVKLLGLVRQNSSALQAQADEVEGGLYARDGEARYQEGDFQGAVAFFEQARPLAPTDPRLALANKAWMKANMAYLLAIGAVILVAIGVGVMQLFSRPRKVKFSGEFKHYGANRTARERDLDLGEEGAPSAQAAPPG